MNLSQTQMELLVGVVGGLSVLAFTMAICALARGFTYYQQAALPDQTDQTDQVNKIKSDQGRSRVRIEGLEGDLSDLQKELGLRLAAMEQQVVNHRQCDTTFLEQVDTRLQEARAEMEGDWESLREEIRVALQEARAEMEGDWESLREELRQPRSVPKSTGPLAAFEELLRRAVPDDPRRLEELIHRVRLGADKELRGFASRIYKFCDVIQPETERNPFQGVSDEELLKELNDVTS